MAVKIITDSSSDLPQKVAEELGIAVVPLNVHFGLDTYRDGVEIQADEFYKRLSAGPVLPTTSAPSPGIFRDFYKKLAKESAGIVSIHLSNKLSGTYEVALAGKREANEKCRIDIINSYSVSMGLGLLAINAAKAARAGASIDEIVGLTQDAIRRVYMAGALDTLEFLQKGGRIGKAQAWLGSLLSIKPLISLRDGEVIPLERVRTSSKAIERLYQLAAEHLPAKEMAVIYSTNVEEAQKMVEHLKDLSPQQGVYLTRFGPVLGTYVGPGCLAVVTLN